MSRQYSPFDGSADGDEQTPKRDSETDIIDMPQIRHSSIRPNEPIGVATLGLFFKFDSNSSKRTFHRALVLVVTFLAYTCFHMGRRPLSIVKNVLNQNCSEAIQDEQEFVAYVAYESPFPKSNGDNWCDWPPFDDDTTANQLLALLDSAFLFSYAFFMFISGFLADRCNLRYFLSLGMILSGLLLYAFGLAYYMQVHSMTYFVIVQIVSGAVQTTGWPTVVTCIGNWFDQSSRGFLFGLWNSNTNLGNILGATIAGYFVRHSWGLSFIVPGFIMLLAGLIVFLFLVPKPEDVGLSPIKAIHSHEAELSRSPPQEVKSRDETECVNDASTHSANRRKPVRNLDGSDSVVSETDADSQIIGSDEQSPLIEATENHPSDNQMPLHAASFWTCLKIPGVIEFSLSLGFSKLVSYTFLYWLPRYITQSTLNNSEDSAYLSVPFDLGGALGAVVAGYISDRTKKSALTCTVMLILAIPAMFIYEKFAAISNLHNILLQLVAGSLVNGPYALITTAVSTDLGGRIKDGKAMATVAAIIDGTGSIGAAIGPLIAGYISDSGWQSVFMMLMVSDFLASTCLARVTLKELGFR